MNSYHNSILDQFKSYKALGFKTFNQLTNDELHWQPNEDTNSIAIIVKHMVGNMFSRWTNFLTEDGEKEWRDREDEFVDSYKTIEELTTAWEKGWDCVFDAITNLSDSDLERTIYIRNEGHLVTEAIARQLAHYSYHIGQIVFIGKMIKGNQWQSLSIPKGESVAFNAEKFSKEKSKRNFSEE